MREGGKGKKEKNRKREGSEEERGKKGTLPSFKFKFGYATGSRENRLSLHSNRLMYVAQRPVVDPRTKPRVVSPPLSSLTAISYLRKLCRSR